MNKTTIRVIAIALCISLISYPQSGVSSAEVIPTRAAADLKSESQFRSEATRYDGAMRAIAGIGTMKLETTDDLKRAIAILDRERSNLKLFFSKLVVLTISDSTFVGGVKKKIPDKQTAESFLRGLQADHKAVLKVDGAESLATRLRGSAESDAAILRRTGERLREATAKIRRIGQGVRSPRFTHNDGFKMALVGFTKVESPTPTPNAAMQVVEMLLFALFCGALAAAVILYGAFLIRVSNEETGQAIIDCKEAADARYVTCAAGADIFKLAECYTVWLFEHGACLLAS